MFREHKSTAVMVSEGKTGLTGYKSATGVLCSKSLVGRNDGKWKWKWHDYAALLASHSSPACAHAVEGSSLLVLTTDLNSEMSLARLWQGTSELREQAVLRAQTRTNQGRVGATTRTQTSSWRPAYKTDAVTVRDSSFHVLS